MRVALNTLGCRLNEAELERWGNDFQRLGYSVSSETDNADIIVVNTCAVTREAVKKSRQLLRKFHRHNPQAKLVVSGCYSTLTPDIMEEIEGIDLLIPNQDKDKLADIVNEQLVAESMPSLATESGAASLFVRGRNRAFVKVQDGCRYRCTFCIVTVARGSERSRTIAEIIEEINALQQQGVKEVVLTGVHIGGYGSDIHSDLQQLVKSILAETDIPRLRLGSVEPWDLHENFFDLFTNPRFMPHLHLPLQSGADRILRRMARRCMSVDFAELLATIRRTVTDFNATTDVIVGFPGESEADWQTGLAFIESCEFSHIHIFPYSPRQGTHAAGLSGQIDSDTKKRRTRQLVTLGETMRRKVMHKYRGRELPVLFENRLRGSEEGKLLYTGYTPNYIKVKAAGTDNALPMKNRILNVRLSTYDEAARVFHAEVL